MTPLTLEALVYFCAKQLADEETIDDELLFELYTILSLYFVVPMSEITVTLAAILFFKFENKIRPLIAKVLTPLPDWLRYGGSIIFFLVMIDDTLFYFGLIALAFWSSKQVQKENKYESIQEAHEH